jgi:hypothetical protein
VIRTLEHPAADRRVLAFRILADDEEIDVAGTPVGQRARDAGHQPHRTKVDVLIELAPEQQQRAPERDVIRDGRRPANGAEENGLVGGDLLLPVVRQHPAVTDVVVAAGEVEVIECVVDAERTSGRLEDAETFGDDLASDPVAGNDRNAVIHPRSLPPHLHLLARTRGRRSP